MGLSIIRFLLVLASIPALESRLRSWSFKLEFNELQRDTEGPLSALTVAVKVLSIWTFPNHH